MIKGENNKLVMTSLYRRLLLKVVEVFDFYIVLNSIPFSLRIPAVLAGTIHVSASK